MTFKQVPFDQIGYWSEVKLEIIKKYAATYSRILSTRKSPSFYHIYIDAFAGAGIHISKDSGEFVPGSPVNALWIQPPFRQYYFIDLDQKKVEALETFAKQQPNVHLYHGDCNRILLETVLPRVKWKDYRRALCILDPYGLHLDWEVIAEAGRLRSIELFLNFPVADINRNVLWRDRQGVPPEQIRRMNTYWGDESWKKVAYTPSAQGELFGPPAEEKASNETIVEAFRKRLNEVAGFEYVPEPIAMRNTQNAVVYYLYFASHEPVAGGIVKDIFTKYRNRRAA